MICFKSLLKSLLILAVFTVAVNYSIGIIFDEFKTDKFLKKVSKSSAKFKVYFMSFSAEGFFEEIEVNQNIIECRTVPVPLINSIHRIYRELKA